MNAIRSAFVCFLSNGERINIVHVQCACDLVEYDRACISNENFQWHEMVRINSLVNKRNGCDPISMQKHSTPMKIR